MARDTNWSRAQVGLSIAVILGLGCVAMPTVLWLKRTVSGTARLQASGGFSRTVPEGASRQTRPEPLPPAPSADSPLSELGAWIRPRSTEEQWLQIDWLKSLDEGQKLARESNRLVFLWGTNEPLGRC